MSCGRRGKSWQRHAPQYEETTEVSDAETSAPAVAADAPKVSFGALRLRDFRILWTAVVISNVGTWMHIVAQAWLMYQLTNSAFWLGLVGLMRAVPLLGFPLIGGVVA